MATAAVEPLGFYGLFVIYTTTYREQDINHLNDERILLSGLKSASDGYFSSFSLFLSQKPIPNQQRRLQQQTKPTATTDLETC